MRQIFIIAMAAAAFLISGCQGIQPDEVLLPRTDISLTVKGEDKMVYDEATCQIGYNTDRNEFRMVDDKLTNWMIFRCDATPREVGQQVKADLEYTVSDSSPKLTGLSFTVKKADDSGMVWLWNEDRKIGIVIKVLQ